MKNSHTHIALITVLLGTTLLWSCGGNTQTATETAPVAKGRLPKDVKVTCSVPDGEFKTWFASGNVTENGKVLPANSVTFPSLNNCSFYTWSEQMFLWLLSPEHGDKYTPGNTVLESPEFYDVSEANGSGQRVMTQHAPGKTINVTSALKETGPNDLPMVKDDKGRLFEVELKKPSTHQRVLLMNAKGKTQSMEVDHVMEGTDPMHHIFMDQSGKVIEHPKAMLQHKMNQNHILEEFKVGDHSVYLDTAGNEVNISVGQATGDVLMAAQNGSIVYYVMMVNDVYAYYLTAVRNNAMSNFQFPTTAAERDSICAYARKMGATLPDSNALAMELKLALVETKNLKDEGTYVTIDANVPVYDSISPYRWVPTGRTRKAKLALIGIHVVGSLANHPEMSWATFEHKNNAPNGAYQYINDKNDTVLVPADTGKGWLLCMSSADQPYNVPYMTNSGDTIDSTGGHRIGASSTDLLYAFGSEMNTVTNPENRSSAASNSEVIGINNNIIGMLAGNDIRKNYILIGATWTSGGAVPTGASYSSTDTTPGVAIGTSLLANSTMETYFQNNNTSCFTCHHGPTLSPDTRLSHIFSAIQPLKPTPKALK